MIILLNGTSSAGKTTLARQLQQRYDGVMLLYGVDTMVQGAFPEKCDEPPWNEQAIRLECSEVNGSPVAKLLVSPYMYPVYRSAVQYYRLLSAQGYNLIVDELLFDANRIDPYFDLLLDQTVYFIGVKPERDVVVQRERERSDRIPGLAAGLYDEVYHRLFSYDLLLDTGRLTASDAAVQVLAYLAHERHPTAFKTTAQRWALARTTAP